MADETASAHHSIELSAVITRADGTVEDLGVIAAHHTREHHWLDWLEHGKPKAEKAIADANARQAAK
jgi:hypothetical protein